MAIIESDKQPAVRPEAIRRVAEARKAGTVRVPLSRVLGDATALFQRGDLARAEDITRRILLAKSDVADAHNLLGAILHARGEHAGAAASFAEAARLSNSGAHYANLGEVERLRGDLKAAAKALGKAIRLDPNSAQAHNNLGIVHFEEGDYTKAVQHYRKALAARPGYAEAYNNLGNALRLLDRTDEAFEALKQAIALKQDYPDAYNNLGSVLRDLGREREAEDAFTRALQLSPNHVEAAENMAALLVGQERHEDALRLLADVLRRMPDRVPTLVLVGRAQIGRKSWQQAEVALRAAIAKEPDQVDALVLLGHVLHELDKVEEAIACLREALRVEPAKIEAHNLLATALKTAGKLDEARDVLLAALKLQPETVGVLSNLADLEKYTPDNPRFLSMLALLDKLRETSAKPERVMSLHYALGKAYDDMGEHVKAFDHYAEGARIKRAQLTYDEAQAIDAAARMRALFSADYFANRPFAGLSTEKLIFIVGMPRSGSTLTEQILASHPQVFGAGEIKILTRSIGRLRQRFPHLPRYPEIIADMQASDYEMLARFYSDEVGAMAPDALRITDKLLSNYMYVGLINVLFPKARIIHTMRHPLDTCLSTFSKHFKDEMAHSYDLGELGRYYRRYDETMQHWRKVLPPGVMLDVRYEDVVANTEERARELIAFCGLEWDERCLAFHQTVRPVKTASVSQVRKPVYTSSVERWRRYGDRLQPLIEALGLDREDATRPT